MTPTEAVALARLVKAVCPAQVFDEFTADVWGDLLVDVRLEDAQVAVKRLGMRQRFVAPSEIRDEVRAIRAERLERFDERDWTPPAEIADKPQLYIEWIRACRKAVADGGEPPVVPALPERLHIKAAIEAAAPSTFRRVPEEPREREAS